MLWTFSQHTVSCVLLRFALCPMRKAPKTCEGSASLECQSGELDLIQSGLVEILELGARALENATHYLVDHRC